MSTLIVGMSSLPTWIITAIFAGIAGAFGALIGELAKRAGFPKLMKVLPIVAVMISLPLIRSSILPAIEEAALNEGLPKQLDEVTILESVSRTPRGIAYHYQLIGDIPADFRASDIKDLNLAGLCSTWQGDFAGKRADKIDYLYRWATGSGSFSVTPSDC